MGFSPVLLSNYAAMGKSFNYYEYQQKRILVYCPAYWTELWNGRNGKSTREVEGIFSISKLLYMPVR